MKVGDVFISKSSKREIAIEKMEYHNGNELDIFGHRLDPIKVHFTDSVFGVIEQATAGFVRMLERGGFVLKDLKPFFGSYDTFRDGRSGGRWIKILTIAPRVNDEGVFMYFIESKWDDGRITYSAVKESYLYAYADGLATSHRGRRHDRDENRVNQLHKT